MAQQTIRFEVDSVTEGTDWSGQVSVPEDSKTVTTNSQFLSWSFPPDGSGINFSTLNNLPFPSSTGSNLNYFTFRSQTNSTAQFPTPQTGISLDIWSDEFHTYIIDDAPTWATILNLTGGSEYFDLSTEKYTLLYDYDNLYAPYYSKGGRIRFYQP